MKVVITNINKKYLCLQAYHQMYLFYLNPHLNWVNNYNNIKWWMKEIKRKSKSGNYLNKVNLKTNKLKSHLSKK